TEGTSSGWSVALRSIGPGTNELMFAATGAADALRISGQTLLLPGNWYRLAAGYDGTEGTLYLDGAPLAQGSGTVPTHDGPIFFGGGVMGYDSFVGRMDEIRTRTNHLTLEQISLRAHYKFEEPGGDSLIDSGVDGQAAVLVGSSARVSGREGQAVDLRLGR